MEAEAETKRKHLLHWLTARKVLALFVLVLAVTAYFVGARLHQEFAYAHKINFQEYAPSWLPQGIRLTGKKVDIEHNKRLGTTGITLSFSFNNSPNSAFYEEKAVQTLYGCDKDNNGNDSCMMATSPHGQQYQLLMTRLSGSGGYNQTINLNKGSASMTMMLRGYAEQPYSRDVINKIVDSFVPVHYRWLPGSTSEQCQCGG